MMLPTFNENLGLPERVKDFAVEKLVAKLGVEAFAIAVLPRAAGLDVSGSSANSCNPFPDRFGDELWTII